NDRTSKHRQICLYCCQTAPDRRRQHMPVAAVTGASRGLGLALTRALAERGWDVVVDARNRADLDAAAAHVSVAPPGRITAIAGDVADPDHRRALADAV